MTPQEFELRRILRIYYASQTCKNGVAAIQIFMWFYMLSQFMQAKTSTRRSRAMYLGVSFILMALAVTIALVGSMDVFNTVFRALPTEPEPSFKIWLNGYKALGYLGDLLGDISFFVADALLIYRCYVICFDFTWLAAIPATIYLANLGLAISGYVKEEGRGDDRVDAATVFLLVFNNIILTCIISWRLLRGHRELAKSMPMVQHSLYTGAVAVLAESAAPMAVFGLGYGIVTAIRYYMETGYAFTIFTLLFQTAFALCPQIIIFRIAIGKSQAHRSDASDLGESIQFASGDRSTGTVTSSEA